MNAVQNGITNASDFRNMMQTEIHANEELIMSDDILESRLHITVQDISNFKKKCALAMLGGKTEIEVSTNFEILIT